MTDDDHQKPVVIVAGSSGFVGSHLIDELTGNYISVGLDIREPDGGSCADAWVHCDLLCQESVHKALGRIRNRHGARIAAVVQVCGGDGAPHDEGHAARAIESGRRLLRGLQTFDRVEQFILCCDAQPNGRAEFQPTFLQAIATAAGAESYARNIPLVELRMAEIYDDRCHSGHIAREIWRVYTRQSASASPGTGHSLLIHIEDLKRCLLQTIKRRKDLEPVETFVIAESDPISPADLRDHLGPLIHGTDWPTLRIAMSNESPPAELDSETADWLLRSPGSAQKHAQDRLDWQPRHRLVETLPLMIETMKRNPDAFFAAWLPPAGETVSNAAAIG